MAGMTGNSKRTLAAFLSLLFLFSAVGCGSGKKTERSKKKAADADAATDPDSAEENTGIDADPSASDTDTTAPAPKTDDVTGSYRMEYGARADDSFPCGVSLELLSMDGKVAVLFEHLYDDDAGHSPYPFGPYVIETDTSHLPITVEYEDDFIKFSVTADGLMTDVTCDRFGGDIEIYEYRLSGRYQKTRPEDASQYAAPVAENDPNTPGGAVDAVLARLAREQLHLPEGTVLTEDDLAKIEVLELNMEYSASLNGIEYFTNLYQIWIQDSYISDISPLANLPHLEEIHIYHAPCLDTIPDLSSCTHLRFLLLSDCNIKDVTPVASIGSLMYLHLSDNNITSVAPLKDLDNLLEFDISRNPITDWETISGNEKLITAMGQDYDTVLAVLERARSIVNETITGDMSDLEKELAIYQKVHEIADIGSSEVKDPVYAYSVLMEGKGFSYDYVEAVQLLMTLAGLECSVVRSYSRDWNIVKIDGAYYEIDCFEDHGASPEEWGFFNLSRGRMNMLPSHQVEGAVYPLATSTMMKLQCLQVLGVFSET